MGISKRLAKKQEKKAGVGMNLQSLLAINAELRRCLDNALDEVATLRERLEIFGAGGNNDMNEAVGIITHMQLNKNGIEFRRIMRRIHEMQPIDLGLRKMLVSLGEENEYLALVKEAMEHIDPQPEETYEQG